MSASVIEITIEIMRVKQILFRLSHKIQLRKSTSFQRNSKYIVTCFLYVLYYTRYRDVV